MTIVILLAAAVVFVGFAAATQYSKTTSGDSVPKRVWGSVVLAGGVLGAALPTASACRS